MKGFLFRPKLAQSRTVERLSRDMAAAIVKALAKGR